jgi:predicted DNA binding CopG/RHH family protein
MKEKKRKVGRPKLPKGAVKNVLAIRLSEAERQEYKKRAAQQGLKLSDWIRQALQSA